MIKELVANGWMSKGVERVLTGLKDELKSKNLSLEIGKHKGFSDGSMKVLFYLPCVFHYLWE